MSNTEDLHCPICGEDIQIEVPENTEPYFALQLIRQQAYGHVIEHRKRDIVWWYLKEGYRNTKQWLAMKLTALQTRTR